MLKEYSERLVTKLEEKNIELLVRGTALAAAANAVMITDGRGIIQWVNPAFLSSSGYAEAEVIGQTPRILRSGRHDANFYREFWTRILGGESWQGDFVDRRKDGSIFQVHQTVTPVRAQNAAITHFVGIMQDVTDQRRTEDQLRETHAQLQQALDYSPAVIYRLKIAGDKVVPVLASANITRLLGYTVEETMSMEWWLRQLHPDDRAHAYASIAETLDQGTSRTEYRLRHKNGTYRWVDDHRRLIRDPAGRPVEFAGVWTDITERRAGSERIRESERRFRETLENLELVAMKLDPTGVITFCNSSLSRLTGREREDLMGTSCFDLTVPQSAATARENLDHALANEGFPLRQQYPVKCATGELREISWSNTAIRDAKGKIIGVACIGDDVTERWRAAAALQNSERRFRALFEQAAVGVGQAEVKTGRFIDINQCFCTIVGRSHAELMRLTFADITHPEDVARSGELMHNLVTGAAREYTQEKRYLRADHSVVWVTLTVSAMWLAGEAPNYCIAVIQDITERKQLEEQYRQAQKMEAIGTLAGGIAHDFNNILAAISGYAELAKMETLATPRLADHLDAILHGTHRAVDLVRRILAFSRQQRPERKYIQLAAEVIELLKLLRPTIPPSIEFVTSLASDAPVVLADASQIHQVLMNLAMNAVHAMRDHPGRLTIELECVCFDATSAKPQIGLSAGRYACLSVSDTGHGMAPATLARIFEPFFTTKGPGEGTGLGLAVVHGIMQSHDGLVDVSSFPGKGTTFRLYFPAQSQSDTDATAVGPMALPRGQGERILYLDDELPLVNLIQRVLERLGYKVHGCSIPAEAIAAVRATPNAYDLVLTDHLMAGMTGIEVAQRIHEIRADLPVVLVTGYAASMAPDQIQALGIRKLLLKPISVQTLAILVQQVLLKK